LGRFAEENFLPKREQRLSSKRAIEIAKKELGLPESEQHVYAKREAFSWRVYWDSSEIGGHAMVVVDDNGHVLAISKGY
jgi:hypothetical protein